MKLLARYSRSRTFAEGALLGMSDVLMRPTARWRRLPDFLIIGAQRAGTTTLHQLLTSHERIRGPRIRKGLHYFDTGYGRGVSWYRTQFPFEFRRVITGEASPYYLFHPLVPERISGLLPEVKLIVLLRDPVERAVSHHAHETRRGFETLPLEAAIETEGERLAGEEERMRQNPFYNSFAHQHFSYIARGQYADQIARYRALFPEDQLLVVGSENMWTEPESQLIRIFDFLGMSPLVGELPHVNATRRSAVSDLLRSRIRPLFQDSNARLRADESLPRLSWT